MKTFSTLLIISLLSLMGFNIQAQVITGILKDKNTSELLQYVNVGVVGKNIGTVSDEKGVFKINVPAANDNDILKISMVGYDDLSYTVADFRKQIATNSLVLMQHSNNQLKEVVIKNKKLKEKILGNKTKSQGTTVSFSSNKLGNEIGMMMKIKKSPTRLKTFTASLASKENYPVKMRLNFYSVKDGMPNESLLSENIIVTAPKENTKLEVDLTDYGIVVEDDFFVTLEWIENAPGGIAFSAALFASPFYARDTSQANWEKVGIVGIGFTCKVLY